MCQSLLIEKGSRAVGVECFECFECRKSGKIGDNDHLIENITLDRLVIHPGNVRKSVINKEEALAASNVDSISLS